METPWITPGEGLLTASTGLARYLHVDLPGTPRGAVAVFCSPAELDGSAAIVLNALAEHGYESCAVEVRDDAPAPADELVQLSVELLARRGWAGEQIGVVGYGPLAGGIALAAASAGVGASVTVGPAWPSPAGLAESLLGTAARGAEQLSTPWLGLFAGGASGELAGASDAVEVLAAEIVDRAPAFVEFVRYPQVAGEFYLGSGRSVVHAAAFDSWQRTVEWLNLRVVPRPTQLAELWRARLESTGPGPGRP